MHVPKLFQSKTSATYRHFYLLSLIIWLEVGQITVTNYELPLRDNLTSILYATEVLYLKQKVRLILVQWRNASSKVFMDDPLSTYSISRFPEIFFNTKNEQQIATRAFLILLEKARCQFTVVSCQQSESSSILYLPQYKMMHC